MKNYKIPRFSIFIVLFSGVLIYSFLNTVIISFSYFRQLPQLLIQQNPQEFKQLVAIHHQAEKRGGLSEEEQEQLNQKFDKFFDIESRMTRATEQLVHLGNILLTIFLFVFMVWFHWPLYQFFYRKRNGLVATETLRLVCKKRIVYSSLVIGVVPAVFVLVIILFNGSALYFELKPSSLKNILIMTLTLETFSAVLTGVLLQSWQKYRVEHFYLYHIFTGEELRQKLPASRNLSLRSRLWLLITVTTFFPLSLVVLFVIPSITYYSNPAGLTNPQLELLLGSYFTTIDNAGLKEVIFEWLRSKEGLVHLPAVLFVNMIDTPILLAGLLVGIFISLLYSILLIRFSTASIVKPLYHLQNQMQQTSRTGTYHHYALVQTNDEIGDLSEGFNRMLAGLAEREKVKGLFGQYLTREVSEEILNGRVKLGGDLFQATIMFSDIRNFTSMSENMSPEEVLLFLNSYMERMIDVIVQHGGIIDKFMGDGILATFGVPVRSDTHAEKALKAALDMQKALQELNQFRQKEKKPAIQIGIGLHTGVVIAGNIGNQNKTEYTVIGDTVNLASRIEGLTKKYKSSILISDATYELLPQDFGRTLNLKAIPNTNVRGKQKSVNLYRVF